MIVGYHRHVLASLVFAASIAHAAPSDGGDYRIVNPSTGRVGGAAVGIVLGAGTAAFTSGVLVDGMTPPCTARLCSDMSAGGQTMLKVGAVAVPAGAFVGGLVGGILGAGLSDDDDDGSSAPREHAY